MQYRYRLTESTFVRHANGKRLIISNYRTQERAFICDATAKAFLDAMTHSWQTLDEIAGKVASHLGISADKIRGELDDFIKKLEYGTFVDANGLWAGRYGDEHQCRSSSKSDEQTEILIPLPRSKRSKRWYN